MTNQQVTDLISIKTKLVQNLEKLNALKAQLPTHHRYEKDKLDAASLDLLSAAALISHALGFHAVFNQ